MFLHQRIEVLIGLLQRASIVWSAKQAANAVGVEALTQPFGKRLRQAFQDLNTCGSALPKGRSPSPWPDRYERRDRPRCRPPDALTLSGYPKGGACSTPRGRGLNSRCVSLELTLRSASTASKSILRPSPKRLMCWPEPPSGSFAICTIPSITASSASVRVSKR